MEFRFLKLWIEVLSTATISNVVTISKGPLLPSIYINLPHAEKVARYPLHKPPALWEGGRVLSALETFNFLIFLHLSPHLGNAEDDNFPFFSSLTCSENKQTHRAKLSKSVLCSPLLQVFFCVSLFHCLTPPVQWLSWVSNTFCAERKLFCSLKIYIYKYSWTYIYL